MSGPTPKHPPRGPNCPAPAVLEALSAGENPGEAITKHVDGCADCHGYVSALVEERDAFNRMRPPEQFLARLERREKAKPARSSWFTRFLPAVALAGLALVVVTQLPDDKSNGVLVKGDELRVVYRRGETAEPVQVQEDARLRAGDALRFSFDAPEDGHLLILDLDGTGSASVFYPMSGTRSAPIKEGDKTFLPGSVVLDAAPGPEWLVAVFSPKPLDAAPLLAQLREQAGTAKPKLTCEGCKVSTLRIQKQSP